MRLFNLLSGSVQIRRWELGILDPNIESALLVVGAGLEDSSVTQFVPDGSTITWK